MSYKARLYKGVSLADTSQPVSEEARGYGYDNIGTRTAASGWDEAQNVSMQLTYSANQLNQYDLISSNTGPDKVPTYDDDGNMTSYGDKVYKYNAENRLVVVEPDLPVEGSNKLMFVYDYMGRRVQKRIFTYSSGSWDLTSDLSYLYDGWNMIEELDATGQPTASYVWGLDLSQSMQAAGGVGGLLARIDAGGAYTYTYDVNGNVGQMLNDAGTIAAHYEYDPYGNAIKAFGVLAETNPYKFSTKYFDAETDLYYYGYRHYMPGLGRWLNRDPIGEQGGINLYGFVGNGPVGQVDPLGLISYVTYRKLGFSIGKYLWNNLWKVAGHVYLAIQVDGKEVPKKDRDKWCSFLHQQGFEKKANPQVDKDEYDRWLTFSFHPRSVDPETSPEEGNLAWTLITNGSKVQLNNSYADIYPVDAGIANKETISRNFYRETELFRRAYKSYSNKGRDYAGEFGKGLKRYNGYGFLNKNCGGWAKYIVDSAGLKWPAIASMYNGGAGVNGPADYPFQVIDAFVRGVYFAHIDNQELYKNSPSDLDIAPYQFEGNWLMKLEFNTGF